MHLSVSGASPSAIRSIFYTQRGVIACVLKDRTESMSDQDKRPDDGQGGGEGPQTGIVVKARPRTKKPAMYKVLMLNDDYTPMEFVVHVLERFFQKNREEATRIMELMTRSPTTHDYFIK